MPTTMNREYESLRDGPIRDGAASALFGASLIKMGIG
jgi:hypothetical protein